MPIDPNTFVTLAMMFPIKDLNLTLEQLALLDENDIARISQLLFTELVRSVNDFEEVVQRSVHIVIQEKRNHLS